MEDVVIIDAARSAVGRKGGSIGGAHPADMLGQVMMQLLARNNLTSEHVDQVVGGCVNKLASQGHEHHPHGMAGQRRRHRNPVHHH